MACEDNGIGRPCDIGADAGQSQAVYNNQALECPSRICCKPVNQGTSKTWIRVLLLRDMFKGTKANCPGTAQGGDRAGTPKFARKKNKKKKTAPTKKRGPPGGKRIFLARLGQKE